MDDVIPTPVLASCSDPASDLQNGPEWQSPLARAPPGLVVGLVQHVEQRRIQPLGNQAPLGLDRAHPQTNKTDDVGVVKLRQGSGLPQQLSITCRNSRPEFLHSDLSTPEGSASNCSEAALAELLPELHLLTGEAQAGPARDQGDHIRCVLLISYRRQLHGGALPLQNLLYTSQENNPFRALREAGQGSDGVAPSHGTPRDELCSQSSNQPLAPVHQYARRMGQARSDPLESEQVRQTR
mmetsp:Transcript_31851/g.76358  ORF Transcript_31851/g.76358 Transcript_31851/m.76358 type:complete len:239 (-) Transcript_31851:237-953(-)